jgi:hypothetical protein
MNPEITVASFSKHLFCDMDKAIIDFDKHKAQVVYQVVMYGIWEDCELIRKLYPHDVLKETVLNLRAVDKKTLSYLALYFNVDKTEFRCFTETQSPQSFWNC